QPLDRWIAACLANRGASEPGPVSDARFARRIYLDLWGLLPTPEQLHSFLDDRAPGKRQSLIAALLADDRRYADHWVSFWNDLLRNDEGVIYHGDRKTISDWLTAALEKNLPYDRVVRELLDPGEKGPAGFLIGVNWRGDISASQTPAMQAAQNSAQIFLGINLKCNSCHDSFISRWKLKDAYGLASYFSEEPRLELFRCDTKTGQFAGPGFLYPELNLAPRSPSLADRHAAAAAMFTDPRNGRLARTLVNRIWQRMMGRALVEPVDDMDAEPWSPGILDWLSADFAAHGYNLRHLIATIAASRAYQMPAIPDSRAAARQYAFRGPEVRRLSAEQFVDALGAITGEWRVLFPRNQKSGVYEREWRLASTPLSRALGRPIRDQVITERNQQPTTLQFLELLNGETITRWLERASARMLDRLPPAPASAFDSGSFRGAKLSQAMPVDIDVSGATKLWLLVVDEDSYSPDRVLPVWAGITLVSPGGTVRLDDLKPVLADGLRAGSTPVEFKTGPAAASAVRVRSGSRLVYDLTGRGFTRLQGSVGVEKQCLESDISAATRFFIYSREPDLERLIPVGSGAPSPPPPGNFTVDRLIDRVYWNALSRAPSVQERQFARQVLSDPGDPARPSVNGLADLLWAITMLPEFQLIV
ncbi:MAG: DUF1549 domain-containing protein, partial [Acidobacteria bacterium]|nr:DUF1549 domain-containing protein [Acidobacteriota bacterium]